MRVGQLRAEGKTATELLLFSREGVLSREGEALANARAIVRKRSYSWATQNLYNLLPDSSDRLHSRTFCMVVASGGGAPSQLAQATDALFLERREVMGAAVIAQAEEYAMHGGDY